MLHETEVAKSKEVTKVREPHPFFSLAEYERLEDLYGVPDPENIEWEEADNAGVFYVEIEGE